MENCPKWVWPLSVSATPRFASAGQSTGSCARGNDEVAWLGARKSCDRHSARCRWPIRAASFGRRDHRFRPPTAVRTLALDRDGIVHEDAKSCLLEAAADGIPTGVDVMVSRDDEDTMRRGQRTKCRHEVVHIARVGGENAALRKKAGGRARNPGRPRVLPSGLWFRSASLSVRRIVQERPVGRCRGRNCHVASRRDRIDPPGRK